MTFPFFQSVALASVVMSLDSTPRPSETVSLFSPLILSTSLQMGAPTCCFQCICGQAVSSNESLLLPLGRPRPPPTHIEHQRQIRGPRFLQLRLTELKCPLDPNGFANLRPSPALGFIHYSLLHCLPRQEKRRTVGQVLSAQCGASHGAASAPGLVRLFPCAAADTFPFEPGFLPDKGGRAGSWHGGLTTARVGESST